MAARKKVPAKRTPPKKTQPRKTQPKKTPARTPPAGTASARKRLGQPASGQPAPAKPTSAKRAPATKTRARAAPGATPPAVARPGEGAKAPAFTLPGADGQPVSSRSLEGRPYVLYFYPRADTPGCTAESIGFRDTLARFAAAGVTVVGASPDSPARQKRFCDKYDLPFPLLADEGHALARAYGAWVEKSMYGRKSMGIERSTFLVDATGKIARAWRGVRVAGHVEEVLEAAEAL
jgi:peroxiredoxin Q/BCP